MFLSWNTSTELERQKQNIAKQIYPLIPQYTPFLYMPSWLVHFSKASEISTKSGHRAACLRGDLRESEVSWGIKQVNSCKLLWIILVHVNEDYNINSIGEKVFYCYCFAKIFFFFNVDSFLKSLLNLLQYWFCFIFFCFFGHRPKYMWDLSSPTKDQTCTPCIGRWSLNHWITREVPAPSPTVVHWTTTTLSA